MDDVLRPLIGLVIPAMNFILLMAVGLDLEAEDFARVRRQPALVAMGLMAPLVLLPPIAIGLSWLFQPPAQTAVSLLLIAACPIGGISNTFSYLARASTALSVTLTALSCLAGAVTIPLLSKMFELVLGQHLGWSAPLPLLMGQLGLVLAVPVALGMSIRRWREAFANRHAPALRLLAFGGTALVLALIIVDAPGGFVDDLPANVPLSATFVACSALAGWMTAVLVSRDERDRFTLAAEFGARNIGVAMAIAVTMLGSIEFARFAVVYALTEIFVMLGAVVLVRRRQASDLRRAVRTA
jgi:BASS family bile acid:Na+ symporter